MRSEVATLLNWVESLPDELVRARPTLRVYHAWALLWRSLALDEVEFGTLERRSVLATLVSGLLFVVVHGEEGFEVHRRLRNDSDLLRQQSSQR